MSKPTLSVITLERKNLYKTVKVFLLFELISKPGNKPVAELNIGIWHKHTLADKVLLFYKYQDTFILLPKT